jgi:hypothetical protein
MSGIEALAQYTRHYSPYDSLVGYEVQANTQGYPRWSKKIQGIFKEDYYTIGLQRLTTDQPWVKKDSLTLSGIQYHWINGVWVAPTLANPTRSFKFFKASYDVTLTETYDGANWRPTGFDTVFYDASHNKIRRKNWNYALNIYNNTIYPSVSYSYFYDQTGNEILKTQRNAKGGGWAPYYSSKDYTTYYPDGKKGSLSSYTINSNYVTYKHSWKDSVIYDAQGRIAIVMYYNEAYFLSCHCYDWYLYMRTPYNYYSNSNEVSSITLQNNVGGTWSLPQKSHDYIYDAQKNAWANLFYYQSSKPYSIDSMYYDNQNRNLKNHYKDNYGIDKTYHYYYLVPYAPTNPRLTKTSSLITLHWTDNALSETSYTVERATSPNGVFAVIATLGKDANTYQDNSIVVGQSYNYRVYATNAEGNSPPALITYTYTLLDPPVVSTSSVVATGFSVNWNAIPNAITYFLDVSTVSDFSELVVGYSNLNAQGVTSNISGLQSNVQYYVRSRAYDGTNTSPNSNAVAVITDQQAPVATAASNIDLNSFTANWNSTNNAAFYVVDVATDNAFGAIIKSSVSVGNSLIVPGLITGKTHYYRVISVSDSKSSPYSNIVSVTPFNNIDNAPVFSNKPSSQIIYLASEGTATGSLQFTLTDADGDPLAVSAVSSDKTLVADGNISVTLQADGTTYQIDFQNVKNQTGTTIITVSADDGKGGVSNFNLNINIQKTNQAIIFNAFSGTYTYGDGNIQISAAGGASGNAITYLTNDQNLAQIVNGNEVKIVGSGTVTITASQAGNAAYNAAPDASQQLLINKKTVTITANDTTKVYGSVNPLFKITYSGFVNGEDKNILTSAPIVACLADTSTPCKTSAAIAPSDAASSNYNFLYVNGTLSITCKPPVLYIPQTNSAHNSEVLIPISVKDFKDIVSAQFEVTWDPAVATFVDAEGFGLNGMDQNSFGVTQVSSGKLMLSWDEPNLTPQTKTDGSSLFSIRFKLAGNYGASTTITISNVELSEPVVPTYEVVTNVITQAGLLTINPTITLNGKVFYPNNEAVQNVDVNISGSSTKNVATDASGMYALTIAPQSPSDAYSLSPKKLNDPSPLNGIDVQDVAATRRHVLQTQLLGNPYQVIAADINESQTISTLDIVYMQALILGINTSFPYNKQWTFTRSDYVFPNSLNPFPYPQDKTITATDLDTAPSIDFIGIKLGDVNEDRDNSQSSRQQTANVIFETGYPQEDDDIVTVPIKVYGFNEISAYQFTIKWDTEKLDYLGKDNGNVAGEFGEQRIGDGMLATIWDHSRGKSASLQDGSTLFTMKFRKKTEVSNAQIELHSITPARVFDGLLKRLNFATRQEAETPNAFDVSIYPNPFTMSSQVNIRLRLPEAGQVRIEIIAIDGRKIRTMLAECSASANTLVWDGKDEARAEVESGVYVVKIINGNVNRVMKVVKN